MRVWFLSAALTLMCIAQSATAGTLLIVGDSISAGFGLDTRLGWVSLLEQRLKQQGYDDKVVNASISGDTSAGGLARLPALLAAHKCAVRWRKNVVVNSHPLVTIGVKQRLTGRGNPARDKSMP